MMTFEQVEKRNKLIMENAIKWANGEDCQPLYQLDVFIVSEYLSMNLPKCFEKFECSEERNHARVSGAEKTIFKTLEKIAKKLENRN